MYYRPDRRILVSIHDVMPGNLDAVAECLQWATDCGLANIDLLVVPGLPWTQTQLQRLRAWQAGGHRIAAHGWVHRAAHIRGFYHQLHSRLLSRDVAEHLALEAGQILPFIARSLDWFARHEFGEIGLYVPPAWALGRMSKADFACCPVAWIETTGGIWYCPERRFERIALCGYEADTLWRRVLLRSWNAGQWAALRVGRRLRISIHPLDTKLQLAAQLRAHLKRAAAQSQL